MSDLLALDPSVRSPGAAIFRDNVLLFAGKVTIKGPTGSWIHEGQRWQYVIEAIVGWAKDHDCILPSTIVYERPQIYTASKSKGDPNDLIALAAIGAGVVSTYCEFGRQFGAASTGRVVCPIPVQTPTPAQWAGQIPKATKGSAKDSPRAKRIMSRLSPVELARMPNQHDAIDAIGLGLHALGRLGIRRSYTNGV